MKSTDLKKGMTVKWLESPFDKHYTRGVFDAFGGTVHKAWVKRRIGGRRLVPTRELLRPWQKYTPPKSKRRHTMCEAVHCRRPAVGYGQGHLLCGAHVDTPLTFKSRATLHDAHAMSLPPLCAEPKCGVPIAVGKVWCKEHAPVESREVTPTAPLAPNGCTEFRCVKKAPAVRDDFTPNTGPGALDECMCGRFRRAHTDYKRLDPRDANNALVRVGDEVVRLDAVGGMQRGIVESIAQAADGSVRIYVRPLAGGGAATFDPKEVSVVGLHVKAPPERAAEETTTPWAAKPDTQAEIAKLCDEVKEMLLAKNKAYGDSALDPVRIFSKSSPIEQIHVRLDDKLSRLSRGSAAGEDVINDLIGYLVLLKIAMKRKATTDLMAAAMLPGLALVAVMSLLGKGLLG